jgi:putative membrane protein insertion efficiency factor
MRWLAIRLIRFYQRHLRRQHNRVCIYQPSCSEYTILAIQRYGSARGLFVGYHRVRRCNGALFAGGDDWL